jgi:hypothetical protein
MSDGRWLVLLALAGVAGASVARGSRATVRPGRSSGRSTTKTITVSFGVTTEESLEAGDTEDVGFWYGDGRFVSSRKVRTQGVGDVVPWVFEPDDASLRYDKDEVDPHERTVRAVAQFILDKMGQERSSGWPTTTREPLPDPADLVEKRERIILPGADTAIYAGNATGTIRDIQGLDLDFELEQGWSELDAARLLELLIVSRSASALLSR